MKFKTIFLIFNIVIVFSFLVIFFMPFFLFGSLNFSSFFQANWLALAIFFIVLVAFNIYFLNNFKLFSLLEEENWLDLIKYLEERIYVKDRINGQQIKILLNAYLVTTNTNATLKLEKHLASRKQNLVSRFAIQFGVPYLLNNQPEESEAFFGRMLAACRPRDRNWVKWNYALSLVQQQKLEPGRALFLELLDERKDAVLLLLTLYILKSFAVSDPELKQRVEEGIAELRNQYNILTWRKMVERRKTNVEILVLSKIIEQAGDWLFSSMPLEEEGALDPGEGDDGPADEAEGEKLPPTLN